MESFATPYPVIFFDGEQEHDKGPVGIHSVLSYKRFQALIGQKTGIPPNQLSAFLVCRRTLKDTEKRQKLPINSNTNFNIILNQHNPSKERDCYFLVSVKKSKRERKGSRKRGPETDNPDDCESTSSRGDASPSEERAQGNNSVDEAASQAARSPYALTNPSSPAHSPFSGASTQRFMDNTTLNGRTDMGGAFDHKVGRILLKRQVVGPNVASMPSRTGWNSAGQGLESSGVFVGGNKADDVVNPQAQSLRTVQPEDQRKLNAYWTQESFSRGQPENDNGLLRPQAPFFLPPTQMDAFHPPISHVDAFRPDRFSDVHSQGPGPRPSLGLQRSGALPPGVLNLNRNPLTRSSTSSIVTAGLLASRVPPGSSAMATIASKEADLRRAHAHLLQLQQQQHRQSYAPGTSLDFSGYPASSSGSNAEGQYNSCQVCFDCRRMNISPIPFHWCVQDKVTNGFRGPSPAGPIGRPAKRHAEAVA